MEEQIDVDFNPTEYLIPKGYFIDRTFWEHIDENMDVPSKSEMKFYVPTIRARKGWMEKLKQVYNLEPQTVYESSIVNLPEEITAEEIEEHRLGMNKFVVKSLKDPTPVGPPEKLDVNRYLMSKNLELNCKMSFARSDEVAKRIWEGYSDKEKRICRWSENYGFLWDYRDGKGVLFPHPKDIQALKFETTCEYFFHLPQFPLLLLSLGCEPNSDRAIYGLRREARLDWPFDKIWTGVEHEENGEPRPKYIELDPIKVEQNIILPFNRLLQNLEYILSK